MTPVARSVRRHGGGIRRCQCGLVFFGEGLRRKPMPIVIEASGSLGPWETVDSRSSGRSGSRRCRPCAGLLLIRYVACSSAPQLERLRAEKLTRAASSPDGPAWAREELDTRRRRPGSRPAYAVRAMAGDFVAEASPIPTKRATTWQRKRITFDLFEQDPGRHKVGSESDFSIERRRPARHKCGVRVRGRYVSPLGRTRRSRPPSLPSPRAS